MSQFWSNKDNWSLKRPPNNTDDVVMQAAKNSMMDGNYVVKSITLPAGYNNIL